MYVTACLAWFYVLDTFKRCCDRNQVGEGSRLAYPTQSWKTRHTTVSRISYKSIKIQIAFLSLRRLSVLKIPQQYKDKVSFQKRALVTSWLLTTWWMFGNPRFCCMFKKALRRIPATYLLKLTYNIMIFIWGVRGC